MSSRAWPDNSPRSRRGANAPGPAGPVGARPAAASEEIAARALLVHCEDDGARRLYERFGEFEPSPLDPLHLYLLMGDLRRTLLPTQP